MAKIIEIKREDKSYQGKPINQLDGRLTKFIFNRNEKITKNLGDILVGNGIRDFGWEYNSLDKAITLYLDEEKGNLVDTLLEENPKIKMVLK